MAHPSQRLALVVGVAAYDSAHIASLDTATNDACDLKEMLVDQGGFLEENVMLCIDPTKAELDEHLEVFRIMVASKPGCVALLYYAGHGMAEDGKHYMVAKDWKETLELEGQVHHVGPQSALRLYACELEGKYGALSTMQAASAGIALFDACRSGPTTSPTGGVMRGSGTWRGASSLQLTADCSRNLLVCFACAAQHLAADGQGSSPFAAAVHKHLCSSEHMHLMAAISAITDEVYEQTRHDMGGAQAAQIQCSNPNLFNRIDLCRASLVTPMQEWFDERLRLLVDTSIASRARQQAADDMWPKTWGDDAVENMQALVDIRGVHLLMTVATDTQNSAGGLRGRIFNIFQNMACHDTYRDLLVEQGAVLAAINLFVDTEDDGVRGAAHGALGNLLFTEAAKRQAISGLERLISYIQRWAAADDILTAVNSAEFVLWCFQEHLAPHSGCACILKESNSLRNSLEVIRKRREELIEHEKGRKAVDAAERLSDRFWP